MTLEKAPYFLTVMIGMLSSIPILAYAQTASSPEVIQHLLRMDVEQLLDIEITSAARKPQKLVDTPSAVYIITQDDIRRSGATRIPEALRLAPGVQVARIGTDKWAISMRGFNDRFSNKLLVMMDGRSVYDPLYSGVFWHAQDTVLEDIDRIEVIRGPGATLWGANAVNGIINIITKSANQTQGNLVNVGIGNATQGELAVRHGGRWGEATAYRVYAKGFTHDASLTADGQDANDTWRSGQGGFRLDSALSATEQLTVQGDFFHSTSGEIGYGHSLFPPYNFTELEDTPTDSYNLLTRYSRRTLNTESTLQFYYDFFDFRYGDQQHQWSTFDLDWQQRLVPTGRHDVIWGLGYRRVLHAFGNTPDAVMMPAETDLDLFSGFVQDEITLTQNLSLTLGAKLEHNDCTDWEIQPSVRLLWNLTPVDSAWGAISRAVRTPSRAETGLNVNFIVIPPFTPNNPGSLPIQGRFYGDPNFDSETVMAYEAGWRRQWNNALSTDIALFWNDYDQLRSATEGTPFLEPEPTPHLILPLQASNRSSGQTYGLEIAADWHPRHDWRLQASYSYLEMNIDPPATEEGQNPRHQFSLLSSLRLPAQTELNLWLRYVDDLSTLNIPAYTTLDARLAWSPLPKLELSLVGQNLLDNHHPEFYSSSIGPVLSEIERSVYLKALWRF